ncbi:hypothetical protein [Providencia stuartii]|uniref:hypothetical protein n=1 Tax=Providencia stuartii TaxID=588 RepID=UPI0013A79872|nr:hypothetical protein G3A48_14855 [Providencia stuartii]
MSGYELLQRYHFDDQAKHRWTEAMSYLLDNYDDFPTDMDVNIQVKAEFKGFRFVKSPEGEVLFGNCIVPAITADDFYQFKAINSRGFE